MAEHPTQDPKVWTVAVCIYQFSQALSAQPYTVMVAFTPSSLPVLAVFLACQKVILRGIILTPDEVARCCPEQIGSAS